MCRSRSCALHPAPPTLPLPRASSPSSHLPTPPRQVLLHPLQLHHPARHQGCARCDRPGLLRRGHPVPQDVGQPARRDRLHRAVQRDGQPPRPAGPLLLGPRPVPRLLRRLPSDLPAARRAAPRGARHLARGAAARGLRRAHRRAAQLDVLALLPARQHVGLGRGVPPLLGHCQ